MTTRFLLEKAASTRLSKGIYRWSLSHQHRVKNPNYCTVGPVSITSNTDQRNCILESEYFTNSTEGMTMRGDTQKPHFYHVFPNQRYKHEYQEEVTGISADEVSAFTTYWFDGSDLSKFWNESYVQAKERSMRFHRRALHTQRKQALTLYEHYSVWH